MGYWKDRKVVKNAKLALTTTRKLYRKNRKKISPAGALAIERDIADLADALHSREIPAISAATVKLGESFEKYLSFARKSVFREYAEAFLFAILLALILRTFIVQLFKIPTGSMQPTLHGAKSYRWAGQPYGDHILVNKFIYGPKTLDWAGIPFTNIGFDVPSLRFEKIAWRKPQRGDIIVFKFPFSYHCWSCQRDFDLERGAPRECPFCRSQSLDYQNKDFIKRLVGLPGETLEIRDGDIIVNGEPVVEPRVVKDIYYRNVSPDRASYGIRGQKFTVPEGHYFVLGDNSGYSKDSRYWGFVPFENVRGKAFFIYLPPWRVGLID